MAIDDPLIGRQLGSFRIERLLGRGGMAKVYYGLDVHLQRPVAVKIIDERYRDLSAYAERFTREARAMASWQHPNIPQVHQAGREDGISYYAMEFIHGLDLERLLKLYAQRGELPPTEAVLRIGEAVADALDYAHQKGAIHRDVKPSNILVSPDGRTLLTDFGLVMQIAQGTMGEIFGSPHYISPEQARSSAQTVPQSDIYSLGIILYEMLVGRLPFDDSSPVALAMKHVNQEPPAPRQVNPDLSPAVEFVLLKALRKSPEERYQSGRELMSALRKALVEVAGSQAYQDAEIAATIPILPGQPAQPREESVPATAAFAPRRTVSGLHLDALVASQLSDQPRQTQAFLGSEPRGQAAASPSPPRFRLWGGIGCALLLALAALTLVSGAVWGFSRFGRSQSPAGTASLAPGFPTRTATAFVNRPATQTAAALAQPPLPTATATRIPATPTSAPTPTWKASPTAPPAIRVQFAVEKDDSLFLINQGPVNLPLALIRLGNGEHQISGSDWDVRLLEPGQCVSVWKEEGKPRAPKDLECKLVGERLERSGPEKFWASGLEVYYRDDLVGTCKAFHDGRCTIRFSLSKR